MPVSTAGSTRPIKHSSIYGDLRPRPQSCYSVITGMCFSQGANSIVNVSAGNFSPWPFGERKSWPTLFFYGTQLLKKCVHPERQSLGYEDTAFFSLTYYIFFQLNPTCF
ncbi:hypothetical protein CEXT_24121 [Caerostris extrusa]|uniref:Uncharacterized protein n=1 Tax=Caerostris extrusa TaxID=172846 RepID=A0AAV4SFD6_CAEEX|nr:hypothetical protein CEXT_24121 [Caerostris extrusa]